jgi:hypothetical protein
MIIDEDGSQSTNVAGTSFAAGQARYNLPPLSYAKPNQRISTNDMIAYLAEEAPKNGERFELSATAVNPRWFPVVATASKGELLNGITNRSGNSRLHNAIQCVTCLFKNVSARLDGLEREKGPFETRLSQQDPTWSTSTTSISQTTMPCALVDSLSLNGTELL